jgi:type 1 glutamine amidotransferase
MQRHRVAASRADVQNRATTVVPMQNTSHRMYSHAPAQIFAPSFRPPIVANSPMQFSAPPVPAAVRSRYLHVSGYFRRSLIPAAPLRWITGSLALIMLAGLPISASADSPIRVLLIDGQNNHDWKATTPLIRQTLEGSGRFVVDVATSPAPDEDISQFKPDFDAYAVVVSNYNGKPWAEATQQAFEKYVSGGGGFVSVHAADNSFPDWSAYNRMIGVGGWGGRNEKDGPYVRWRDGKIVRDKIEGRGGSHGSRHPFVVVVRDDQHPITAGLPEAFTAAQDELYAELRGPAENMHVLATAFSSPDTGGTGQHEPILMTVQYGDGRVFHTTLGHDTTAMNGLAFQTTLQRGTEWAATGDVTFPAVDPKTLTSNEPAMRNALAYGAFAPQVDANSVPNPEGDGWRLLFNGTDLEGWTQKNGTASYKVEEGTVVGRTAVGSPNSFLCTTSDYGNFELAFEVKVDNGLNSGVQIRSLSKPEFNSGRVHGPQVEIESLDANGTGDSGYVYSEGTGRQWLSTERPIQDAFKNDQWNQYLVRAVGDRIETWVNGRKVADLTDPESSREGFIGLQVHSIGANEGPYEVRWRKIKLRPLAADAQYVR